MWFTVFTGIKEERVREADVAPETGTRPLSTELM